MNAPWGLPARLRLVLMACQFFRPSSVTDHSKLVGKEQTGKSPTPLTVQDFLKYLDVRGVYTKTPSLLRVSRILDAMATAGLLLRTGASGSWPELATGYIYLPTEWEARRGQFRFVSTLGPELLYDLCEPGLVHITGTKKNSGQAAAGTGIVVDPSYVLTCRHVLDDMELDGHQVFQSQTYPLESMSLHLHPDLDVALLQVADSSLVPLAGAVLQRPVVGQVVHTLGYAKLPGLRDASVTLQPGAVTNESVQTLAGDTLFLYSAIARPGNSGGPVMSEDGYLLGLSTVDASAQYGADEAFSPHYAGIPAHVLVEAVSDLEEEVELPFEHYE